MKRVLACYFVMGFVLAGCSSITKTEEELAVSTQQELNASKSQSLTLTQDIGLKNVTDEQLRQDDTKNRYYLNNFAAIKAGSTGTDLDAFINTWGFNVVGADVATAYYYNRGD